MRKDWHKYFMDIAFMVAERSTCDRKHVGCVITKDKQLVSSGYNGSIAGTPHCDEEGHMMEKGHCVRVIHAEQNAMAQAAKYGISLFGSVAYITAYPCWQCFKLLANSGIIEIYYSDDYRIDDKVKDYAGIVGIRMEKIL